MVQHEASLNHRLHYIALVRPFQLIVLPSRPNINIAIKSEIQVKKINYYPIGTTLPL